MTSVHGLASVTQQVCTQAGLERSPLAVQLHFYLDHQHKHTHTGPVPKHQLQHFYYFIMCLCWVTHAVVSVVVV